MHSDNVLNDLPRTRPRIVTHNHDAAQAARPGVAHAVNVNGGESLSWLHRTRFPTFGATAESMEVADHLYSSPQSLKDAGHHSSHVVSLNDSPNPAPWLKRRPLPNFGSTAVRLNDSPPDPDDWRNDTHHGDITPEEYDIAASPAAMFLSAFTPVAKPPPTTLPDAEGQEVAGYILGPIIGHGGFSTIRRAHSSSGATVAVKIVRKADVERQDDPAEARRQLDTEAAIWNSLSHEHILPLFSISQTPYADFFVTLLCPAGSLFDILRRDGTPALPQDDAGMMFRQVVRGLRYLHDVARLVHGDIKLENVLVDEMGMCRIGDFGLSRRIGGEDKDRERQPQAVSRRQGTTALPVHLSLIRRGGPRHRNSSPFPAAAQNQPVPAEEPFNPGSLPYAAPELLVPTEYGRARSSNPAQDIWALGVLLYALLTGRLPFEDAFEPRLQVKIIHGVYDSPEDIGQGAEQVLAGCLTVSASARWTIGMVDDAAWGVGWGAEGDRASLPPTPLNECVEEPDYVPLDGRPVYRRSASHSQSHSRAQSHSRVRPAATPVSPSPGSSPECVRMPRSTEKASLRSRSRIASEAEWVERSASRGRRSRRPSLPLHTSALGSGSGSRSPSPSVPPRTPVDFDSPVEFRFGIAEGEARGRRGRARDWEFAVDG